MSQPEIPSPLIEKAGKATTGSNLFREEILSLLETTPEGLSSNEAKRRALIFGKNALPEKAGVSSWTLLLGQLNNIPVILLLVASAISFVLFFVLSESSQLYNGFAVVIAVTIVMLLGFRSEWSSQNAVKALKKLSVPKARVLRDKKEIEINSEELVPGDIILLKTGSRVPADARILEEYDAEVNESLLTGESLAVIKAAESTVPKESPLAERKNMLFMGTTLMKGSAKTVVVAIGDKTQMGQIAELTAEMEEHKTPLQIRLDALGKRIGWIGITVCILVFVVGLVVYLIAPTGNIDEHILLLFTTAVALAVAAIPEGLPIVITIILSLGTSRMAKRNAIITRLNSVETLGCTRTICSDKTGTITQNVMTVRHITLGDWNDYQVTGEAYETKGEFYDDRSQQVTSTKFQKLIEIGALCNESAITKDEDGLLHILGSAIEGALLFLTYKAGQDPMKLRTQNVACVGQIPFNSEKKRMISIYNTSAGVNAYIKGAPEAIADIFTKIDTGTGIREFTNEDKVAYRKAFEKYADMALYILALGYKQISDRFANASKCDFEKEIDPGTGFIFVGFIGVQDPPRPEVKDAVRLCHEAGIDVVMITGDNARTAQSIAQELSILQDPRNEMILNGSEIETMPNEELDAKIEKVRICSRVAPEHKLKIVQSLQRKNHVAAMTGDGVNDVPALRQADIGVAMGSGTDVAKASGNMILVDNNFATIVTAVEEGRSIYSNLKKFITSQLSTTISLIIIVFSMSLVPGWDTLLPIQLLWMNILMDGPPAQALGIEPKEPGIMQQPPRPPDEEVISSSMWRRIFSFAIIRSTIVIALYSIYKSNPDPAISTKALTIAFTVFIFLQLFNAYNCRSPTHSIFSLPPNKMLYLTTGLCALIQVIIIYTTPSTSVFYVYPLTILDWGIILGTASFIIIFEEIRKIFVRRQTRQIIPS